MNPGVLIRELRLGGGKETAALKMALWQVRGEIAASELGDPSTPESSNLKRQQFLLLDILATVDPPAHRRLKDLLEKADEHPAVEPIARRIARKPPTHRTPADFNTLINAFVKAGGFAHPPQESRKDPERPAGQARRGARPEVKPGPAEDGISDFRPSTRRPTWRQTLGREHLRSGILPIPAGVKITGKRAGLGVSLGIDHRSHTEAGRVQVARTRLSEDCSHLILEPPGWPADFFPGIVVDMSWIPQSGTFVGQTHELDGPLVIRGAAARIDGRYIGHRYDPQVVTRETAPGGPRNAVPKGLSDTDWVLRALQILGYLDADGRAVLAEDALERNMVGELGFPPRQTHRITQAVKQLIGTGLVSRVKGSLDSRGNPVYPPVPGRTPVTLLSFSPFVPGPSRPEPQPKQRKPSKDIHDKQPHTVSGFVRRLPAGQNPSDEAIDAHKDAQRAAEVANRGPLKPGYTFVRRHRRSGRRY